MKSKKGWVKSKKDLAHYMPFPCEISESMYLYLLEVVACTYGDNEGVGQCGEACDTNENGVFTYDTVSIVNGRYFYLGILPEFKIDN